MSKILVVDDEPHIVKLITFSLTKNGFECLTAGDGDAGASSSRARRSPTSSSWT